MHVNKHDLQKLPRFHSNSTKRHFTTPLNIPLRCKMNAVSLKNIFYSQTLATQIQNMSSQFRQTIK